MRVVQKRLSVITDARASLNKEMRQLERLRDQVKKAELFSRRSRPRSRTGPSWIRCCCCEFLENRFSWHLRFNLAHEKPPLDVAGTSDGSTQYSRGSLFPRLESILSLKKGIPQNERKKPPLG
jgi:hypothetical protein